MSFNSTLQFLGLSAVLLCLASCATVPPVSTDNYNNTVQSWKQAQVQTLIGSWGYPKKIETLPDGNQGYDYEVIYEPTLPPQPSDDADSAPDHSDQNQPSDQPPGLGNPRKSILPPALPPGHKFQMADMEDSGTVIVKLPPQGWHSSFQILTDDSGQPIKMYCDVQFEVDANNNIIDVHSTGNYCFGTKQFVSIFANPAPTTSSDDADGSDAAIASDLGS